MNFMTDEERIYVEDVLNENRIQIEDLINYYHISSINMFIDTNSVYLVNSNNIKFARCTYSSKNKTFSIGTGYSEKLMTFSFEGLIYERFWTDSRETYFTEIAGIFADVFNLDINIVRPAN